MLNWLFLIFCSVLFFCITLSLSPYIFLEHFQKKKDRRRRKAGDERTEDEEKQKEKKKKDKEKSRTEVDIEVRWWIADQKTDQLNAFRVNSKRDTLE